MTPAGGLRRILVAIDGSESSLRALDAAITIARGCGSTITGIHCIAEKGAEFGAGRSREQPPAEAKRFMDEAKTRAARSGIDFTETFARGDAGYAIVAASKSPRHGMIVIGTSGKGRARRAIFGGTSSYVAHSSRVPVLLVR
ncbi:Universal stress protein [Nitrosopumilaceae archaeon]|nr:universal stress protein [Nitrosopumilus sp.]CAI9831498.1 Universal stress protein [Nitrosopumilaceae archaeon]MDA7940782.1 universal stress protein [Nitrosopumilus sp.]MDA7942990.1 universal stress protein [Nitrosopumilus sp.]MDA7944599.1 universal stress protein [Nitrosopumilus sp.]